MSKLWITEHRRLTRSSDGHIMQIPGEYGVDQTPVDFSGGAAQSAVFAATTTYISICPDATCSIAFGSNPTATANNRRIPLNFFGYLPVFGNDKLSVVSNT